ncbi:MAG TPA: nuclear transport factor 2 family protein [Pyrinomonadaceae bacterium]
MSGCFGLPGSGTSNARGNRGANNNQNTPQSPAEQTPTETPTPAPTPDPIVAVQKLMTDLGNALAQGNAEQLDGLLSDGYLHINDAGQLVTKPDLIAGVKDGNVKFNSVNIQEVNIRVYGDAAVVNGTFMGNNAAGSRNANIQDRITFVAAREGDNWKFVSGQTTPMHAVPQNGNSKGTTSGSGSGTSGGGTSSTSSGTGQSGSSGPMQ